MAINVTKPAINLREKLNEVTLETGIKGEELLNSDTSTEARNVLELDTHLFTDFESTGIDDNATSTAITIDASEKVGIGTATPSEKLHVVGGQLKITGAAGGGAGGGFLSGEVSSEFHIRSQDYTGSTYADIVFDAGNGSTFLERMRIDSSGEVMIKHASAPSFVLSREDASNNTGDLIGAIGFRNLDTSSGTEPNYCGIKAKVSGGAGSDGELEFYTGRTTYEADSGAAVFIRDTGEMELALGNLKFGTAGKGIDFSANGNASGMTSEVLDDYEEGTWTPVVDNLSGFDITTITSIDARYTKIGRKVTLEFEFTLGSSTGNIAVGDDVVLTTACMPFAPSFNGHGNGVVNTQSSMSSGEDVAFATSGFAGGGQLGIVFMAVEGTVSRSIAMGGVVTYFT